MKESMKKSEVDHLIFIYGSLRQGFGNHRWLSSYIGKGAEFLGLSKTTPEHTLVSLGAYPALIPFVGETSIVGEVYRVTSDDVMVSLNTLEGFYSKDNPNNFYNQTVIETEMGPAITYTLTEVYTKRCPTVESGDWSNR